MRGLNKVFHDDLLNGLLSPLRKRVLADHTLCLEIRDKYINIYYRGRNLLRVSAKRTSYEAYFDLEYSKQDKNALQNLLPSQQIESDDDVNAWLRTFPVLKQAMDLYFGKHPQEEREAQQQMLRENNFGGVSRATDYYICDIEYANPHGRFDLVAVHWPSNGAIRKQQHGRRLVLIEMKYGDNAIADPAGIHSHILDINRFLENKKNLKQLKSEMISVFNQKRSLGLINCGKDLVSISDEPPMLLLALVNHDPDSSKLRTTIGSLPPSPHADIYFATGCHIGYGLFDQAVLPLDNALNLFADRI